MSQRGKSVKGNGVVKVISVIGLRGHGQSVTEPSFQVYRSFKLDISEFPLEDSFVFRPEIHFGK